MLKTEKILNKYGLTFSEAETLLQITALSSLLKAKEKGGDGLIQVATFDDSVVQYLESNEVKEILEANKKEPIVDSVDEDLDLDLDFDLDFDLVADQYTDPQSQNEQTYTALHYPSPIQFSPNRT